MAAACGVQITDFRHLVGRGPTFGSSRLSVVGGLALLVVVGLSSPNVWGQSGGDGSARQSPASDPYGRQPTPTSGQPLSEAQPVTRTAQSGAWPPPAGVPVGSGWADPAAPMGGGGMVPDFQPWQFTPGDPLQVQPPAGQGRYQPRVRDVPMNVYVEEAQTGRFMLGGSVNTDLGVAGNVMLEERNFDLFRFPRSFGDLFDGAFRGGGQNFRLELMPGNLVQRYTATWTQPNLFGYSPWNLSVGGFYFNRFYRDWTEDRLGGRVALGYNVTPDLSLSTEIRGENVDIRRPRIIGVPALDSVLGDSELYTGRVRLAHNTRDSPFMPTEGHFLELVYDQVFGTFDYPRGLINYSKYFLVRERPDGTGRHTLTSAWRFGFSGKETPIFENFYAGGFTTLRGFRFRGAGPVDGGVQVGGRFMFLGSLEYQFPLTADDMLKMVTFVDYGTIEREIELNSRNFRVAPGIGLRVFVPALGPGPLAFDFAYPVNKAPGDESQVFSFSVGITR